MARATSFACASISWLLIGSIIFPPVSLATFDKACWLFFTSASYALRMRRIGGSKPMRTPYDGERVVPGGSVGSVAVIGSELAGRWPVLMRDGLLSVFCLTNSV